MSSIVAKEMLEQKLIEIASNGDTTMSAVKPMEQMLARGVKTETLAAVVQYHCPMTDKPITKVHAPPTGKKKTVCYLVNKAVSFTGGGVANHDGYVLTMDGFSPNGSTYDGTAIGIGTTVTSGALVPIPATQYRGNCINLYYKIGSSPVIDLLHPLTTGWTAMTDLSLGTGDLIPNTSAYRVLGMAVKMTDDTDLMYRGGEVRGAKFDLEETEGQYRSQPTPSFDFQQAAKAYDRQASGEGLSQGEFFKYDVPKVEEKDPSPQTAGDYYRQTRIITGMATDGNNVVNHPTYKTGRSEDGFYAIATASDRNWSRMESWTAQPTFACNSSPQSNGTTGWYTPASHNDGFDQTVLQVYNLNTNYKHTINAVYFVESEVDPNSVMVKLSHDEATQDVFFTQVCSEVASVLEPFYPASFNDGGTVFKFIMKAIEAVGNAVSFIPHPLVSAIGTGAAAAAKAIRQGTERTVAVVRQEPQREPRLLAPNAPASVRILSVTQPNHRAEVVHELQNLRMKQAKKRVNVAGVRPPPLPPRPGQARAGIKRKAKAKRPNVRVFPGKPKGG